MWVVGGVGAARANKREAHATLAATAAGAHTAVWRQLRRLRLRRLRGGDCRERTVGVSALGGLIGEQRERPQEVQHLM